MKMNMDELVNALHDAAEAELTRQAVGYTDDGTLNDWANQAAQSLLGYQGLEDADE